MRERIGLNTVKITIGITMDKQPINSQFLFLEFPSDFLAVFCFLFKIRMSKTKIPNTNKTNLHSPFIVDSC
ncbi:hypothetical protein GMD6S_07833 [Streptococcus sp. GMD6S]|nr:hypothetical protein GMD6S_07833 [Streptococcus sp. GMD6S]